MTRARPRLGVLAAFLLVLVGCAEKPPALGVVRGRVTLHAKPVTGATVLFENVETGIAMNAPLNLDGRYEVKTYQGAGLPPGKYTVAVMPGGVMRPEEEGPLAGDAKAERAKLPVTPVPEKYHKAATSGLTVEVKEGENPPFDFTLTP
jgi:hypothetical protein